MRILVCNDDGIEAEGLKVLATTLSQIGEVIVVAPKEQHSGAGHSLTINKVVKVEKVDFVDGIEAYALHGTPRDCSELGINGILKDRKPDLLVSGINKGPNLSSDVVCSGTCGAACAGLTYDIPSIATSLAFGDSYDYTAAALYTKELASWFVKQPFNLDFTLSINTPNIKAEEIKGYKVCGFGGYHIYEQALNPVYDDKFIYFDVSTTVTDVNNPVNDLSGDIYALEHGYVTLTPLQVDMTRYQSLKDLQCWDKEK